MKKKRTKFPLFSSSSTFNPIYSINLLFSSILYCRFNLKKNYSFLYRYRCVFIHLSTNLNQIYQKLVLSPNFVKLHTTVQYKRSASFGRLDFQETTKDF